MKRFLLTISLVTTLSAYAEKPVEEVIVGEGKDQKGPAFLQPDTVTLQGLDKITARIFEIEAKINEPITFGRLTIKVTKVYLAPPEENAEKAAFLEIHEKLPTGKKVLRFNGWMYGSSPALSALEHPIYDVRVKL